MENKVSEEIKQGALGAAVSYIFFICIFVLIKDKRNSFSHYHAKQALVLFLFLIICWVSGMVLPVLGWLISFFGTISYLICSVIGVFSSLMGRKVSFPVISGIAEKMVI